ncbi:MAG TPA: TadE/TadG family type IV pilus assembly protein [Candidatus Limnocylindrales bacterium]|nr:TadE/TadG family type IV pilus assembly protein [Candidatus Limnocylindrales bacterium]
MRSPWSRTLRSPILELGQGLVEFALVLPLILLLLFGAIDLGRAVYAYNTVANAARQGARVAAVNQIQTSPDCVESKPVEDPANPHWSIKQCAVQAAVSLNVQTNDVTVSYSTPTGSTLDCSPVDVGCIAQVTVRYQFTPLTPVVSTIVGTIALTSTSQMPVERVFP